MFSPTRPPRRVDAGPVHIQTGTGQRATATHPDADTTKIRHRPRVLYCPLRLASAVFLRLRRSYACGCRCGCVGHVPETGPAARL